MVLAIQCRPPTADSITQRCLDFTEVSITTLLFPLPPLFYFRYVIILSLSLLSAGLVEGEGINTDR